MVKKWAHIWAMPKKAKSLLVYGQADGKTLYSWAMVENVKGDYKILQSGLSDSLETCLKEMDKNVPLVLTIEGKGVIHKTVDKSSGVPLFQQALSNGREPDFYVQRYDQDKDKACLSLARKDTLAGLFAEISKEGMLAISLTLGFFPIEVIALHLKENNELHIGGTGIIFRDGKISAVNPGQYFNPEGETEVSGEKIPTAQLIPFAAAIATLTGYPCTEMENPVPELKSEDYLFGKLFRTGGLVTLFLFFAILLINFAFYTEYDKQVNKTKEMLSQSSGTYDLVNRLSREIEARRKLTTGSGMDSHTRFSWYSDRLAACMPEAITLLELNLFPVVGKERENTEVKYSRNSIFVKGTTPSSQYINQWIKSIEKEAWAEKIDIGSYQLEGNSGRGLFELTINIRGGHVQ